jgi:hypothetical protein
MQRLCKKMAVWSNPAYQILSRQGKSGRGLPQSWTLARPNLPLETCGFNLETETT